MGASMDLQHIRELLESQNRICVLSTADENAVPNTAIFGSVKLFADKLCIGMGSNRSLHNLRQNPQASLALFVPGDSVLSYQGFRLYLHLERIAKQGRYFDLIIAEVEAKVGRFAAKMLQQVVEFQILEVRPLVDQLQPVGSSSQKDS